MYNDFFAYINSHYLLDIIPLDLLLHALVGAVITIIGLKYKFKLVSVFVILLTLATLKELNDYLFHYPADWQEYFSDFVVIFTYIAIIYLVRKTKKKIDGKNKIQKLKIYNKTFNK